MALEYGKVYGEKNSMAIIHWIEMLLKMEDDDGGKWILNPPFQRGSVWTLRQKQALWESILDDIPIPAFFINRFDHRLGPEEYQGREIVVDGKQRIEAIAGFLQDEFRVRGELWSEQDDVFKRRVKYGFTATVICTKFDTMHECIDLYLKLLLTGTQHTEEEINEAKALLECS